MMELNLGGSLYELEIVLSYIRYSILSRTGEYLDNADNVADSLRFVGIFDSFEVYVNHKRWTICSQLVKEYLEDETNCLLALKQKYAEI